MEEENNEEKGRRRIRDFFEKENLFSLYSSLLPSLSQFIDNANEREISSNVFAEYVDDEEESEGDLLFGLFD